MRNHIPGANIKVRLSNNVLWHAIFDHHKTLKEFCRVHKLRTDSVSKFLNLRIHPHLSRGEGWRPTALKLSKATGIPPEVLFPLGLYDLRLRDPSNVHHLVEQHLKVLGLDPADVVVDVE